MKNALKEERPGKIAPGAAFHEPPHGTGNAPSEFLQGLRKGEILRLRDDCRPFMRARYWVFEDLFMGGGIFLHRRDEGFLEVKPRDIDWEEYRAKKREAANRNA